MAVVMLVASFIGDLRYWYLILIFGFIVYYFSDRYLSAPLNYPTEENNDKSDLCNWRLWLWILILGVGVVGIVFSFASLNWKWFFLWLFIGACCCYRLSKFFSKENELSVEDTKDIVKFTNNKALDADKTEKTKNELIVVMFCIVCIIFVMIWMVSKM